MKRYFAYLLRWQLSGLLMMPVLALCSNLGTVLSVVIAQFIGGLAFYFIDKKIFKG